MEYTASAIGSVLIVVNLDFILKTRVLRQRRFWIFVAVMVFFMTLVNGYLTWRPIVLYGDAHYLGLRLLTIPIEDYLYCFGLITASVVVWEYVRKKRGPKMIADGSSSPRHTEGGE